MAVILFAPHARAQVSIDGVSEEISSAIRAGLSLPETCDQSEWLVRYRFRSSEREIVTTLQTFGYYSPVIRADLHFDSKCWHADFKIDPGPPAIISKAHIEIQGEGADSLPRDKSNLMVRAAATVIGWPEYALWTPVAACALAFTLLALLRLVALLRVAIGGAPLLER